MYHHIRSSEAEEREKYVVKCHNILDYDLIIKNLKMLNECSNISKCSSSYDRHNRVNKINDFIKKLDDDNYKEELVIFKKLIGKNNKFYVSKDKIKHKLSYNEEENINYLYLYIKNNKKEEK